MILRGLRLRLAIPLCGLLLAVTAAAMDLPHYDVDSLVYMSTDIVIAKISEDSQHNLSATVTETLYGSLSPNDRVDRLTPFLSFFRPMQDGMHVVLFLDRRPHHYQFPNENAAKSPFAIPPSGVYLIDDYGHVHEYYQESNPGPYVARGYSFFLQKAEPTREADLLLPTLENVTTRIATAIQEVSSVRPLLDKVPTRQDVPALMHLLDFTSQDTKDCDLRSARAIREQAFEQIRAFDDSDLLLRAESISGDALPANFALDFIASPHKQLNKQDVDERIAFLLQSLSNTKLDSAFRETAVRILLRLADAHSGPQIGPSRPLPFDDNPWLAKRGAQIQAISKEIFDDESQTPRLRRLCLQFLSIADPATLADVKSVYHQTASLEVRFAIEKALLEQSDALYESLAPPGGPVASLTSQAHRCGCQRMLDNKLAFMTEWAQRKDFHQQSMFTPAHQFLMNLATGQLLKPENLHFIGGWSSTDDGQSEFELTDLSHVPAGNYVLAMQYVRDGKSLGAGYGLEVTVRETKTGKEMMVRR